MNESEKRATITGASLDYYKMEHTKATGADVKKMLVVEIRDAKNNFVAGYWTRGGVLDEIISTIEDYEIFEIRDIDPDGIENFTLTELLDKDRNRVIVR